MDEVWILYCTYAADWPLPEREVMEGVYATAELVETRIRQLKEIDPFFIAYRYDSHPVIT